jgi:hypothetical protein
MSNNMNSYVIIRKEFKRLRLRCVVFTLVNRFDSRDSEQDSAGYILYCQDDISGTETFINVTHLGFSDLVCDDKNFSILKRLT